MNFNCVNYLTEIPLWLDVKGIFQNVAYVTNQVNITWVSLVLSARRLNQETFPVILAFHMAIMSRELALVVLIEKISLCGFAASYLINDIWMMLWNSTAWFQIQTKSSVWFANVPFLIVFVIFYFRFPVHI